MKTPEEFTHSVLVKTEAEKTRRVVARRKRRRAILSCCLAAVLLVPLGIQLPRWIQTNSAGMYFAPGTIDLTAGVQCKDAVHEISPDFQMAAFDFSGKFMAEIYTGENLLCSPVSAMMALGMTANGAAGETLAQMNAVLGLNRDARNASLGVLVDRYGEDRSPLQCANAIWFEKSLNVNSAFVQDNVLDYRADMRRAVFDGKLLKEINSWCSRKTNGMIPEILSDLPKDGKAVLINALAFEAEWEDPYEKSQVRKGTFTTLAGPSQTCDMMRSAEGMYLSDADTVGFAKMYKNGYAFVALLPEEGTDFSAWLFSLSGEKLLSLWQKRSFATVYATLPSFSFDWGATLNDPLARMGMPDAFTDRADFSGISDMPLCISRVIQKTHIEVTPTGTRAAAVTVADLRLTSADRTMQKEYTVTLDRPFVFLSMEMESGVPVFIGTLTNVK